MQFQEVGALLREKREEKGISIDEMVAQTKIPANVILAVENGDKTRLPHETFIRSYIKSYALFLGCTEEEFAEFGEEIDDFQKKSANQAPIGNLNSRIKEKSGSNGLKIFIILILIAIIGIGGYWYFFNKSQLNSVSNLLNGTPTKQDNALSQHTPAKQNSALPQSASTNEDNSNQNIINNFAIANVQDIKKKTENNLENKDLTDKSKQPVEGRVEFEIIPTESKADEKLSENDSYLIAEFSKKDEIDAKKSELLKKIDMTEENTPENALTSNNTQDEAVIESKNTAEFEDTTELENTAETNNIADQTASESKVVEVEPKAEPQEIAETEPEKIESIATEIIPQKSKINWNATSKPNQGEQHAVIYVSGDCWMSINIDGKSRHFTMPRNTQREFLFKENLTFHIGNASVVTLFHNKKLVQTGDSSKLRVITLESN